MAFPRWFKALPDGEGHYAGYYCQGCVEQGSNINQCKSQYFCIDCATSNHCQSCFTFGTHARHDKVQVYKATFRDAVREADIRTRLGPSYECIISKLQPYIFNGKNMYFLAPPQECKQAYKNVCLTCRRKETLGEQHEYCSIKCVGDASQITSMLYDNTKASHSARQHPPQALSQTLKSKAIKSPHSKKSEQLPRPIFDARLEEKKSKIVGAQTYNSEESERHQVQRGLKLMEIISNVANGVIEAEKNSINAMQNLSNVNEARIDRSVWMEKWSYEISWRHSKYVRRMHQSHMMWTTMNFLQVPWGEVKMKMSAIINRRHCQVIKSCVMETLKLKVTRLWMWIKAFLFNHNSRFPMNTRSKRMRGITISKPWHAYRIWCLKILGIKRDVLSRCGKSKPKKCSCHWCIG